MGMCICAMFCFDLFLNTYALLQNTIYTFHRKLILTNLWKYIAMQYMEALYDNIFFK